MLTTSPSFSAKELEHYQHVRRSFEGVDALKTASPQYHGATPTRIPAPVGTLAPSILNQVPKPKSSSRPAKPKSKAKGTGKGKGKATVWDSTDDTEDGDEDKYEDEDDAYLTSHDFEDEPIQAKHGVNGTQVVGFMDGADQDDDEIQDSSDRE